MQFKTAALYSLAAGAIVNAQTTGTSPTVDASASSIASIISVLKTALPSSLYAEALTNPAEASSELASEFAAGSTPAWFSSLPSDVQSALGVTAVTAAPANATVTGTAINGTLLSTGTVNGSAYGNLTATASRTSSSLLTVVTGPATTTSGRSSSSTGGAAVPTAAAYGMGLAGLAGLVGIFAL